MATETTTEQREGSPAQDRGAALDARAESLQDVPVAERRLELARISTAILEGGEGRPIVALHGPGANATHWAGVLPGLVEVNRVVAPDLPGLGESSTGAADLTRERILAWLGELIEATCGEPPALVGYTLGGAIAARFASERGAAIERLVLIDALGLRPFAPAPEFGRALNAFVVEPSVSTHDALWERCAFDLGDLRERMGTGWEPFASYNVERARTPTVQTALATLMAEFALPAIPPADLERIDVPTALVWGRHDMATPLEVAESASARYGWPLEVIEDCADDPPVEQPEALVAALLAALGPEEAA
jgi:pimeloyl-ACP methyl ester carboxylesterase